MTDPISATTPGTLTEPRIVLFAKAPVPGKAKTRLTPRVGADGAARAARAMLLDTLGTTLSVAATTLVLDGDFREIDDDVQEVVAGSSFALDVVPQASGDFDERLEAAFSAGGVLVGMDTPQISAAALTEALTHYQAGRTPFMLSADGGWCLLGLKSQEAGLVRGVEASLGSTGEAQRRVLERAGLDVATLPALQDVDTPEDADAVAALSAGTRFAAVWAREGAAAAASSNAHVEVAA